MQIQPILGYFGAILGLYQPPGPPFGSRLPLFTYPGSAPDLTWKRQGPQNEIAYRDYKKQNIKKKKNLHA